jgi:hypothetical protein
MVYLLKMVIFRGKLLHNQRVPCLLTDSHILPIFLGWPWVSPRISQRFFTLFLIVVVANSQDDEKAMGTGAVGHCPTCRAEMHLQDLRPHQARDE